MIHFAPGFRDVAAAVLYMLIETAWELELVSPRQYPPTHEL